MTIKKPHIFLNGGFFKYKKSRGVAGPAALRFYVISSQKPSCGPPQYKYYHYDRDVAAQVVMGHVFTIIREFAVYHIAIISIVKRFLNDALNR
jgi:hypothetical protein